jgi:hypothetical protein
MRKILMITAMLTGLSFATFASENTLNKSDITTEEILVPEDPYCIAGMTSCGQTYMHCFDTPVPADEAFIIFMLEDQARCGGVE